MRLNPALLFTVTVSILMRNALTAAQAQRRYYDQVFGGKSETLVNVAPAE